MLLIDADLRKPRIHRIIKTKNVRGLTSVVLGERKASEVIHNVPDVPNLEVITSGPLPPNPPELFGKLTFKGLLDEARKEYDWVVIDTPPVASVTDPVMCAQVCDLVLLVAQYGNTRRKIIREAVKTLEPNRHPDRRRRPQPGRHRQGPLLLLGLLQLLPLRLLRRPPRPTRQGNQESRMRANHGVIRVGCTWQESQNVITEI